MLEAFLRSSGFGFPEYPRLSCGMKVYTIYTLVSLFLTLVSLFLKGGTYLGRM
jgi:hypothetical protein